MSGNPARPASAAAGTGDPALCARLTRELEGEVLFDAFSRGRYSTDASIYQIEPIGVVVPKRLEDVAAAIEIAGEFDVPVLPRGGGTSQCGQTVARALVVDTSKYLDRILRLDSEARAVTVQPGIVLDRLNAALKPAGLFFPIDPSTASRATLGGMVGNNSCGARSIRYGNTVHNVNAIEAIMATGETWRFAQVSADLRELEGIPAQRALVATLRQIAAREAGEIDARLPKLLRRVGGYNIDTISPDGHNLARLLVGSEGTLAFFTEIDLALQPLPPHKVLGICQFPSFFEAMDHTRHIVELEPAAVELVDRTMIELAREIPSFRATMDKVIRGEPDALLLVEFAGEELSAQQRSLARLEELMASLGYPGAMLCITDPAFQREVWEVRKAGLNIMMSMKGDGKPVSFIEDCAVPLEHLAEYTDRLNGIFAKHGTRGTWYAHASVGCLHVRPVLNMKDGGDVRKMRAIAEECFAMVREYKGSHSGEHGDGIVRSEFHEPMFGSRIVRALEEVKDAFDPAGRFNPGRIVRPPRMDDRSLFRYRPDYAAAPLDTALDWSPWGGLAGAVEMCNNNGACRKSAPGVMCPSYRVTRDEQHVTRGRANALRLALTGQLGPGALHSGAMAEAMALCVSCKGCRRECPTGVDMARMKIEFLHHYRKRHPLRPRERLIAYLPRYAARAARLAPLVNLRDRLPGLAALGEKLLGVSARRSLPQWQRQPFTAPPTTATAAAAKRRVVLWADTFNRYFEPENLTAAHAVLSAAGFEVVVPSGQDGSALCCGRTFLSAGLVDEARREARRTLTALGPHVAEGAAVVGLEPSCLLGLRDEFLALVPGQQAETLAERAFLLEEFLVRERDAGRLTLPLRSAGGRTALVHGHCHQKAFGVFDTVAALLSAIPELRVQVIDSSCCGMAGAFGFEAEHFDVSMRMAELDLLPAVRQSATDTLLVADGTSCRHQIKDGAGRRAVHAARVLHEHLADPAA